MHNVLFFFKNWHFLWDVESNILISNVSIDGGHTSNITASLSILKTDTELSIASSVAILWIVCMIIFFASCFAVSLASSIVFWIIDRASVLASSFNDSTSSNFACLADS